jgi:hypothetical protein
VLQNAVSDHDLAVVVVAKGRELALAPGLGLDERGLKMGCCGD